MVAFHPDGTRLSNLVFWNTVATFLTLGLYRFWARTRLRQYYWHRVTVAGSPAEYLGHGSELFGGFAVVFVFLAVLFVGTVMASLSASVGNLGLWLGQALIYSFVLLLLPFALFRARRYRLTRTLWRGIRFGQDGSSYTYAQIWFGWLLLTALTLGFAYPWRNTATERYRVNHTRLGNRNFEFHAKASHMLGAWMPSWVALLGVIGGAGGFAAWLMIYWRVSEPRLGVNSPPLEGFWADFYALGPTLWGAIAISSLIVFFFLYLDYRVREFRYFLGQTGLGDVRFSSDLKYREVVSAFGPFVLGIIGYLTISLSMVAIIVGMIMQLPGLAATGEQNWAPIVGLLLLLFAVLFFASYGMSLLFNLTMRSRIITAMAASLRVENVDAVDSIVRDARDGPQVGEGLADAFQFGNF